MIGTSRRTLRLTALALVVAAFGAACGGGEGGGTEEAAGEATETTKPPVPTGPDTPSAQIRSNLHALLQEHVVLAAAAGNAAAGGRDDEVAAASAALGRNTDALTATLGSVMGSEAGTRFDELWKGHVDALLGSAGGGGQAGGDRFAADFGTFVNSVLKELPAGDVTELMQAHEAALRTVLDAQRRGDQSAAFTALRAAQAQVGDIAEPIVAAMTVAFPDTVTGDPKSPAATLLTTLNSGLREHVYLASAATGAALGGRQDEFTAAAAALGANSDDLAAAIGSVYGAEAGRAFDPLWEKHITFFIEYTTGTIEKDNAKRDKAVNDLINYSKEFGAFLSSASPELPKDTVAELVKTHALTLKDVIDAQGAKNYDAAYNAERTAGDHMKMIATPLAATIVAQFPDKF